jgi:hypothetical protein
MRVRAMMNAWLLLAALAMGAAHAQAPIEATTPAGERILLHPDGRWEYADPAQRAASPKPAPAAAAPAAPVAAAATPVAAGACPPGSQGHLLGIGRCVTPGDADYSRGSLSGKGR